jgi:hypothetical protein
VDRKQLSDGPRRKQWRSAGKLNRDEFNFNNHYS